MDDTGKVLTWNPYAFQDPNTGNVYELVMDAVVKAVPDQETPQIFTPSAGAYVDQGDGFAYTVDPYAILVAESGQVYTESGAEPVSSDDFPEIPFTNPVKAAMGLDSVPVKGQTIELDGKEWVIYDPS